MHIDFSKLSPPWNPARKSIYSHIMQHLDPETGSLLPDGETLPDEELEETEAEGLKLRFVAGLKDSLLLEDASEEEQTEISKDMLSSLSEILNDGSDEALAKFYNTAIEKKAISFVDAFIERLSNNRNIEHPGYYQFTKWLLKNAPDRDVVKIAISMLSLSGQVDDTILYVDVGTHEEFTLFCAVALSNITIDAYDDLWTLAKRVNGWGRIHVIEHLTETEDPEIKAWLVREGCHNNIMAEYTAYQCATAGDLLKELANKTPDDRLIQGACVILDALLNGAPGQEISSYADAPEATKLLLAHLEKREVTIWQLLFVDKLQSCLRDPDLDDEFEDWQSFKDNILDRCDRIIDQPSWDERIEKALESDDEDEFQLAVHAAKIFEIPTWELVYDRIQAGSDHWYFLMHTDKEANVRKAVALAEELLPLESIASGVDNELGWGVEFRAHLNLDLVVSALGPYPGIGTRSISCALASPVTRNRIQAMNVLKTWGKDHWTAEIKKNLRSLKNLEKHPKAIPMVDELIQLLDE